MYANNKHTVKEIKETILSTIASKNKQYFGINLTKEAKDPSKENLKSVSKSEKTRRCRGGNSHGL